MSLIIGFLTIVLVLTSFLLILLILAQLPKKEAGAGLAFGAGAAETGLQEGWSESSASRRRRRALQRRVPVRDHYEACEPALLP